MFWCAYLVFIYSACAAVYDYYPTSNPAGPTALRNAILQPGDEVNFHAGTPGGSATYDFVAIGSYTFNWVGNRTHPIMVRAFPGDKITITNTNPNTDIVRLSGQYFVFSGFEMIGN